MRVFVTGSESTGKTALTSFLAEHYGAPWVPEYARTYVEQLNRPYTFSDVEEIARMQLKQIDRFRNEDLVFFDTGLIITRVWFIRKFGRMPDWFQAAYRGMAAGNYLICRPDLPWMPDPVRENPDIRRELDAMYEQEITGLGMTFAGISGTGENRLKNGLTIMNQWLDLQHE